MNPGAPQTTTWARAAAPSTARTGGPSAAARTAGAPPTGAALTPTSPTTSADQTTSTLTSALATAYENLRGEEDLYPKKRSGGEGAPGPRFLLTTGSSARGTVGAQPGAPQGCGKAADPETSGSPGTLRTRASAHAGKKGGQARCARASPCSPPTREPPAEASSALRAAVPAPPAARFPFRRKKLRFVTCLWFFLSLRFRNLLSFWSS